jgi:hypothetical protein
MYSIDMHPANPPYRCRLCGAASYRKLTHRGPDGAMQYSGLYRCSGCSVTFSDPVAWREGHENRAEPEAATERPAQTATSSVEARASGSMATWGLVKSRDAGSVPYGYGEQDLKAIKEAAERANRSKERRR